MKKRILSILLTLCMVLMLVPVTAFADESPDTLIGDLDLDGAVTVNDAVHLQNYLEGLESFTDKQRAVADFNGDGEVDYSDLTELQSYLQLTESDITVTNGKAKACGTEISEAASGTRVTLTADSPSDDMEFDKWIVNEGGVTLADASSATTTFTMPAYPVRVTATYKQKYTLAITVDGFEVGKTPNDCTYTFESTNLGVTFSKDDIEDIWWDKYAANGDRYPVTNKNDDAFQADTLYRCVIDLDRNGLTKVPVVTVNGNTPDYCTFQYFAGVPELSIGCDLGTPAEPGSLAITVNGFQVGNTPKDITFSFASTIPGVEFSADDILRSSWDQYIFGEMDYGWYPLSNGVFQADTRYKCYIDLKNNGLTEAPAVTVNGKTPEYCVIATRDGDPYALLIECELGTPEPILTLTVPFTATVKLGGSTAPGETTFELAVVHANASKESYKDVTVSGSVTTNGAGSYEGTMTFKGTFQQLQNMLGAGVFVQQVNAGEPNWTYDNTVWGVRLYEEEIAARSVGSVPYSLLVYPTYIKNDGSFALVPNAEPLERMSFTNTYTYSAPVRDTATIIIGGEKEESKPVEENPNTGAPVAANMSTLSVLVLASAVAVLKTKKH